MSHIVTVKTEVRDLTAIRAACRRLGWELKEGQRSYRWFGEWVGDSPLPEGVNKDTLGTCAHAIAVPGARYEIGLQKTPTGFRVLWDYWNPGGLTQGTGGQFLQAYAVEKARIEARKQGRSVREETLKDGSIRLTVNA